MIHNSAVVSKNAEIDETTNIGPFCIIGDGVKIGKNATIGAGSLITKNIPKNKIFYNKRIDHTK